MHSLGTILNIWEKYAFRDGMHLKKENLYDFYILETECVYLI